jgi:hypothetical protein
LDFFCRWHLPLLPSFFIGGGFSISIFPRQALEIIVTKLPLLFFLFKLFLFLKEKVWKKSSIIRNTEEKINQTDEIVNNVFR